MASFQQGRGQKRCVKMPRLAPPLTVVSLRQKGGAEGSSTSFQRHLRQLARSIFFLTTAMCVRYTSPMRHFDHSQNITIRLRKDQIAVVKMLYPEVSFSVIARILFDRFLEDPYEEHKQDLIHEESVRTNTAIKTNQFKRKEKKENEHRESGLILREQLLRSLRVPGPDEPSV